MSDTGGWPPPYGAPDDPPYGNPQGSPPSGNPQDRTYGYGRPQGNGPYGQPPPPPPRRGSPGFTNNPRAVLWTVGILAVVLILARAHKITTPEIVLFCTIVPSIILHEVSHGWVALACGDDTAKRAGRLTLNPLKHIDPVGTLIVPALMALSGYGLFGWAKPVPVNLARVRSPRNQGVLIALAGPFTNVVLALIADLLFHVTHAASQPGAPVWVLVLFYLGLSNVLLAVFNMIPLPPLDGSVLLERALPAKWWPTYLRLRRYTMPLVLVLVIINFYLNPGPITWLFDQLYNWWLHVVGVL